MIEHLEARGAHFRSLSDPIDTSSPQGIFTLQILGAVAQLERALISERTKGGMKAAVLRGKRPGNPVFGHEIVTLFERSEPRAMTSTCRGFCPDWTTGFQ